MLIKPPIRGFLHEIGRHVPIGLAYLSSVLRQAGHETVIFDALSFTEDNCLVPPSEMSEVDRLKIASHPRWRNLIRWGASRDRIAAAILDSQPDVIGISSMFSPYYEPAYEVARLAKKLLPSVKVLFGGPHATVAYDHVLKTPEIDIVVLGEAETTIALLLEDLAKGANPLEREGLAFRCGEGYCDCSVKSSVARELPRTIHAYPKINWLQNLDTLPFPAADQLQFERYAGITTLITSRGCPFSCTFCTVHATVGKKFRARTPANIADEIEYYLHNFGVKRFSIEDDNFTFDIQRVFEICREIKARKLEVELNLPNGITVVKLNEDLVQAMVDVGFRKLFLGLESTDETRLSAIAKRFTSLKEVERGAAWFADLGADVSASLIVGLPGQSLNEIVRDVTTLVRSRIKFWSNPFYPIPGSPDYWRCIELGIIEKQAEYSLFDQYNFAFGNDVLSASELYWTWVTTQTVAQWPSFIREGCSNPDRQGIGLEAVTNRLIYHTTMNNDGSVEVPAAPVHVVVQGNGVQVTVANDTCFCAAHHLKPQLLSDRPVNDGCALTGDVMAAAITIYTGRPIESREVMCRLNADTPRCVFLLEEGLSGWAIKREFIAGLDAALDPARASELTPVETKEGVFQDELANSTLHPN